MFTVLIVEDYEVMRHALSIAFTMRQFHVATANCMATAREELKKSHYDLFILDIGLPDGSGIDLAKEIREQPWHKNTPILALSAFAKESYEEKCLAAGFNAFFNKPFTMEHLDYIVEKYLQERNNNEEPMASHS